MNSLHVLPLQPPSFVLLVKQLKMFSEKADVFEIWLDSMKVKGDLAVIRTYFKKPMIAKATQLDLLKRGVKAGFEYADIPHDLEVDLEFSTLAKNKGAKLIRSYHNYEHTPSEDELYEILRVMNEQGADFLKISTAVHHPEDNATLLGLLLEPRFKNRLIVTGLGEMAREVRIKAPLNGSVFYYAPVHMGMASAPGQLTREELEYEWNLL